MSQFRRSVVFVDANITDLSHLIRGVKPGVAVSVLTDDANGVDQITSYLSERPADIVHIVSHGAPGVLQLGHGELNLANLGDHASALATWFAGVQSPSLLLYGCNVAAGDAGTEFIEKLHTLTGAAIGASTTKVGNADLGGSWHLDSQIGTPVPSDAFSQDVLETYPGVFVISVTATNNTTTLLNTLLGDVAGLSNIQLTTSGNAAAFGTFSNAPFSFESGIVLSTGAVTNLVGPNNEAGASTPFGTTDPSGFRDVARLTITFDVAAGIIDPKVFFEFVFGSEEFPEYAGQFNDAFELKLNGTNLAKLSDGKTVTINNLAASPSGPFHPDYVGNTGGADIELDAFTKTLTLQGALIAGQTNTLEIFIGDAGDSSFDSAVFIRGGSFGTEPPPPAGNNVPTGTVTISGTATQGQTLTATNNLADADGLGAITYTWFAGGVSTGSTGSTYVLKQSDVGKVMTVQASYTDGGGTTESVTSSGTSAVANANIAPTGSVTISGTATQGQTLTASNNLVDADGISGGITYTWFADGTSTGQTGATYTLGQSDVGKVITVRASYTDGDGKTETVTSSGTSAVANTVNAPTGSVTISGTATQGQTLTASNNLTDADGISGGITYTWFVDGTSTGQTGTTYTLGQADVGKVITVQASYTDGDGKAESVTSSGTSAVAEANVAPTGTVTISGTSTQGQTLTASNNLVDGDGISGGITYTWFVDGTSTGQTGATYTLGQSDVGKVVTVRASYTDGDGKAEAVTSSGTSAVANTVNAPTGSVTISGTATQGGTLTATNDLADADGVGAITYTWFVDGVDTGKTGATYTLGQSDVGKVITVRASYTDGDGKAESVTSSGTSAVANTVNAPTGSVTITGTATQGGTLTATNDLADADGVGAVTYTWFVDGVDTGKTGATYTLGQSDVGKVVTVRASYTDGDGKTESVTSSGTSTVAEANIAPSGTVTISGTATQGGTLTATNDLTDADGLGAVTYTWFVDGVDTGKTGATYTLGQSDVGKVVTVRASYTDGDGKAESVTSGGTSAVANTVNAPTGSVTITGDATQGGTLTATNDLADADGVGTITYTWFVDGVDTGKTGATYILGQSDVGKVVTVRASYTDGDGKTETVTSGGSSTVADASIAPTGTVTITGDATQGGTLTATNDLEDADGLGAITYTWFVDGVDTGKTGATYDLGQSDVGKVITVRASYTDGDGKTESVTSSGSSAVANTSNDPRGGVTIDGTATQGATLTATNTLEDPDGLGELSYQWEQSLDGTTWETISGATASTFTPTQEQVNQFVRAKVSYTDGDGTAESVTSTATTTKVTNVNDAPTGSVTVNGSVRQGCTLTANTSALVDDDGLPSTLSYQWQASSDQTTWTDISGATAATFSPTQAQANQFVRVQVSYIDGQGTPEQVLSQPASPPKPTSDFTGDGQADILWRNATLGSTVVWEMDGPEVQMGHYISPDVDGSWRVEAIADFDGNGSPDLLWQNAFTGEPVLWLFDGLTLASGVELPEPGAFWEAVGAADFNCDNQADILWHNSITGNVELWLMDGTQPVEAVSLLTVPEPWDVEAVGDFSRDGQADILWRNSVSGETVVWLMEGEEVVGAATLPTVPVNWELHGAADFTGDTHLDLLWHNQTTGEVVIWEMQGLTPQNAISLPSVDPSWEAVL